MSRGTAAALVLALAGISIGGCGDSGHVRGGPTSVHLDGQITGDYMREISAGGVSFLVPTGVLTTQGTTSFDIASPPDENSSVMQLGPQVTSTPGRTEPAARTLHIAPTITGTTPQHAHVELLVTGGPGRRIYLSFEESCGFFHIGPGPKAVSALKGAQGQRALRTPAVMILPSVHTKTENTCYVSGVVVTRGQNHLHISLIDY